LDPISDIQPKSELSFPTPYSLVVQPPDLISKSKWVGPIHMWPRWPSLTVGRKKDTEWFSTQVRTGWQGCIDYSSMKALTKKYHFSPPFFDQFIKWLAGYLYYYVLDCYSSNDHYPFDLGKLEHTILTVVFDVFALSLS
jgi:hypothetical protein